MRWEFFMTDEFHSHLRSLRPVMKLKNNGVSDEEILQLQRYRHDHPQTLENWMEVQVRKQTWKAPITNWENRHCVKNAK